MPLRPMYGREKDVKMMSDYDEWPRWPRLPLKRAADHGQIEVGCMLAVEGHLTTVWLTTLFSEIDVKTTKHIVYTDAEAIADDGWVID